MAEGVEVKLRMYDLTLGLASSVSWLVAGKRTGGLWHTSIVVFGKEFYFSQEGIMQKKPGQTVFDKPPDKIKSLGKTNKSKQILHKYLSELECGQFAPGTYNLMPNNSNAFSNEISKFLVGHGIPEDILQFGLPVSIHNGLALVITLFSSFKSDEENRGNRTGPDLGPILSVIARSAFSSSTSQEENNPNRTGLDWGPILSAIISAALSRSNSQEGNSPNRTGPDWGPILSAIASAILSRSNSQEGNSPNSTGLDWGPILCVIANVILSSSKSHEGNSPNSTGPDWGPILSAIANPILSRSNNQEGNSPNGASPDWGPILNAFTSAAFSNSNSWGKNCPNGSSATGRHFNNRDPNFD